MLLDDLEGAPQFSTACKAQIKRVEEQQHQLGSSPLATLMIDLSVGLAGNALYDLIKYGVSAARRRGSVTTEGLDTLGDSTGEAEEIAPTS